MKRSLVFSLLFLYSVTFQILAQTPWHYNFGTGTGSLTIANTADETFLPAAPAGNDRVYVGSAGGGFELVDPLGTDAELKITASTSAVNGSINKFSIYDYTAAPLISIGFNIRCSGGVSTNYGTFYFFIGDGAYYSDNLRYTAGAIFTGLRFTYTATGVDLYILRNSTQWGTAITTLSRDTDYYIEIYGNNSSNSQSYTNNGLYTLAAYSTDLFINNAFQLGLSKGTGLLANNLNIDSFLFLSELSSSNNATISIDEITYINSIINGPLPVELSSFTANNSGKNVNLNWRTETEVNNYGFEVERTSPLPSPYKGEGGGAARSWEKIGFVNGNGNSNSPKDYSFIDINPVGGSIYQYRLKQIDTDGQFAYSDVVEVQIGLDNFSLSQNFPNPFNPVTAIKYSISSASNVKLTVFNILGEEVSTLINEFKEAGIYSINFDASLLNSGIYFYKLESNGNTQVRKMSLLK